MHMRPRGSADPLVAQVLAQSADRPGDDRVRPAPTGQPLRPLIGDMEPLVRLGLVSVFGTARSVQVIGEASTARGTLELQRTQAANVVLVDADQPDGIDVCRRLGHDDPSVSVIVLASAALAETVIAAIHAGAHGYLLKRSHPAELIDAVETSAAGGFYFDEVVSCGVLEWLQAGQPQAEGLARLSDQVRRILGLIAQGKTNYQIASSLKLSQHTVKTHVSSLLKKLGPGGRAEAAAFIVRRSAELQVGC